MTRRQSVYKDKGSGIAGAFAYLHGSAEGASLNPADQQCSLRTGLEFRWLLQLSSPAEHGTALARFISKRSWPSLKCQSSDSYRHVSTGSTRFQRHTQSVILKKLTSNSKSVDLGSPHFLLHSPAVSARPRPKDHAGDPVLSS